ncbi:hypothetical protein [Aquimarina algiphila]|uniref:Uncharacterized protein n=1 Tax=Aquimarina algiphila TaxID=2047982 RepID=A0A554VEZ4_9FLAO|nr:hypothetical protein [Aquimarina algiphila]TSE05676.1 hypothetical protein FOF46_21855 [Aquimarina algiphila]
MGAVEEVFSQIIEAKGKQNEKMIVTLGTVTQVRELDCDVSREELPELLGVRYHSIIGNIDQYMRITPKQGSKVLCAIIENDISEAVIIAYSEIDSVQIKIQGAEFEVKQGKFTIKNEAVNLKDIISNGFDTLINAIITTPSGPGDFSPADKTKFEELKSKTTQLFI